MRGIKPISVIMPGGKHFKTHNGAAGTKTLMDAFGAPCIWPDDTA